MITKKEIGRQLLHIIIGVIVTILFYFNILSPLATFLLIIIGLLTSIISKRTRIPILSYFLERFERDEQKKKFPGKGLIFFFIGVLLVMKLFDKDIALASIMVLAFGDSISHLAGAGFGRIRNIFNGKSNKLFEGTFFGTLAGFVGAVIFVPIPEAFLGSLAAMIAEVIKIDLNEKSLDDNLVVPLVAGTVMLLVRNYL